MKIRQPASNLPLFVAPVMSFALNGPLSGLEAHPAVGGLLVVVLGFGFCVSILGMVAALIGGLDA